MQTLCYGCMKVKQSSPVCEHCGFHENTNNLPHQLPMGTVLHDQYMVGRVLGQGGFGITYVGRDMNLDIPIAIKEYYPNGLVVRNCTDTLNVENTSAKMVHVYQTNRERFIREARILARLHDIPGITRVHNFFEENNTAYIIMEYIDGVDLRHYVQSHGEPLSVVETLMILRPIMHSLSKVHKNNIIHRDISPDNIMIETSGAAKLLDFGAVREITKSDSDVSMHSTQAIAKHGFAPIEQYQKDGSIGPWTDVYALCATIYYCTTGKIPPYASDRMMDNMSIQWNEVPGLNEQQIEILNKGMAIQAKNRIPNIAELYKGLYDRYDSIEQLEQEAYSKQMEYRQKRELNKQKEIQEQEELVQQEKSAAEPSKEVIEAALIEGATPVEEVEVEKEKSEGETSVDETPAEPERETSVDETPVEPEKKATPGKIAAAVGIVVLLAAILIALVAGGKSPKEEPVIEPSEVVETVEATIPADGNPEDVTCKGSYSVSDEEIAAAADTVVATIGEHTLTNEALQIYYWMEVQNFLNTYGSYAPYFGLDYTQPLDTQRSAYDENLTWQQFFLQTALTNWNQVQAMNLMAKDAGLSISAEDQEYLDGLDAYLEETAAGFGITVEELMTANFGPGADKEGYRYFQELYLNGLPYYAAESAKLVPTQEILEAYFDEHAADYEASGVTKDGKFVDVRHILVQVKGGTTAEDGTTTYSDEEWKTCEEAAQTILDEWLAGDKTEESFAALATERTEDPGSQATGGLYQQVYQGQMVPEFNDWCFDESRQYGDYGLVRTSYGYHVMFFVGSQPQWVSYAESDWKNEQSNKLLEDIVAKYPMEVTYENIALGVVKMG